MLTGLIGRLSPEISTFCGFAVVAPRPGFWYSPQPSASTPLGLPAGPRTLFNTRKEAESLVVRVFAREHSDFR